MIKGIDSQPINEIKWIHRKELWSNDYNPNNVHPPEMALLEQSILEDGWLQPLVIREDGEIVDGFHRWKVSSNQSVYTLTDGLLPCVVLPMAKDRQHQIITTVRVNRSRGTHYVLQMSNIVNELANDHKLSVGEICTRLGMESEEVTRFLAYGNMRKQESQDEFLPGWGVE